MITGIERHRVHTYGTSNAPSFQPSKNQFCILLRMPVLGWIDKPRDWIFADDLRSFDCWSRGCGWNVLVIDEVVVLCCVFESGLDCIDEVLSIKPSIDRTRCIRREAYCGIILYSSSTTLLGCFQGFST